MRVTFATGGTFITSEEKWYAEQGLEYGVICEHIGAINEGAVFMFIAPADSPWAWVLVLRGDTNNFYDGQLAKAHGSLQVIEP